MRKSFYITKICKGLTLLSLVFMLFACGINGQVSTAVDGGGDSGIATEEEMAAQHHDCWQANVVSTIYVTTGRLIMGMYDKMTRGAMAMMMIAFAVWMSFQILMHVSSFTEESAGEVWSEVIKKFFVCFVCGLLASTPQGVLFILNSVIFPIYNAFLELGSAVMGRMSSDSGLSSISMNWNVPFEDNQMTYDVACKISGGINKATLNGFPDGPRQMMECLTCVVNERLNFGIKFGWIVMKQIGVMAFFCGLITMGCFFLVKLGFVFYLVDTIFRFAMMVMMLPLLIMSYAFKTTQKAAKTGFLSIINSAAFLMMIAVVIMIIFASAQEILSEQKAAFEDRGNLADFSVPFLLVLLISFLAIKSINLADKICDTLVGGGGSTNFQKQFGAAVARKIKGVFSKIFKLTGAWFLGHSEKLRKIHGTVGDIKDQINALAGRDQSM